VPTRRAHVRRDHRRITPAAIEAYRTGDWGALHHALGLKPFEASPPNVEVDGWRRHDGGRQQATGIPHE
jgi:hypothetical protein